MGCGVLPTCWGIFKAHRHPIELIVALWYCEGAFWAAYQNPESMSIMLKYFAFPKRLRFSETSGMETGPVYMHYLIFDNLL